MSIKRRLWFSHLAMLIVPILLTVLVGSLALFYYSGEFGKSHNDIFKANPAKRMADQRSILFSEIKMLQLESPDNLKDKIITRGLEEKLAKMYSGIIISKNNEVVYISKNFKEFDSQKYLPKFGQFVQDEIVPFKNKRLGLMISQQDFYYRDGSKGSVFIATNLSPILKSVKEFLLTLTIAVILILILTNGTLTYLASGSIIKRLYKLKESANKIKDGNLDFEIKADSKDEFGEVYGAFEEMRERLKSSIELQLQYEENRKELISNISHDLKTPITTIKGYVEGIRDGIADTPEKLDKYINTIFAKTIDVDRLIDDLFLFSKLDLNKLPLNLSSVDIARYLSDIIDELAFDLEKKNISIKCNDSINESIFVIADIKQLKRVVVNIIENAVKYMDKKQGIIDITLRNEESVVRIDIRDNGQGITKDALPFIFERFYRADQSRNTATGGSGLGLSIASKIIQEHGGTMWAESIEGEGTCIFFTLKKYKSGDIL